MRSVSLDTASISRPSVSRVEKYEFDWHVAVLDAFRQRAAHDVISLRSESDDDV